MKNSNLPYLIVFLFGVLFSACSGDDDLVPINIPTDDDDVCCTQDDEVKISQMLVGYKEVTGLSRQSAGSYTIKVYGRNASLSVGYNDLYFIVEKTESGRHVKDFSISDLSPLMDMGMMKHSTPIANKFDQIESFPIYHTWVAPLMAGQWTLSFNYRIKDESGPLLGDTITVATAPEGQAWIKSTRLITSRLPVRRIFRRVSIRCMPTSLKKVTMPPNHISLPRRYSRLTSIPLCPIWVIIHRLTMNHLHCKKMVVTKENSI